MHLNAMYSNALLNMHLKCFQMHSNTMRLNKQIKHIYVIINNFSFLLELKKKNKGKSVFRWWSIYMCRVYVMNSKFLEKRGKNQIRWIFYIHNFIRMMINTFNQNYSSRGLLTRFISAVVFLSIFWRKKKYKNLWNQPKIIIITFSFSFSKQI